MELWILVHFGRNFFQKHGTRPGICIGHNFLADAIFSNPLSQVIYIFPFLCIDTNIDQINLYKNGNYGYLVEIDHYGLA